LARGDDARPSLPLSLSLLRFNNIKRNGRKGAQSEAAAGNGRKKKEEERGLVLGWFSKWTLADTKV